MAVNIQLISSLYHFFQTLLRVPGLPSGKDDPAFLQVFRKGQIYWSQAKMDRASPNTHFRFLIILQMHLERLPVQRWWGIPSRWHKNTPTSQGKKFSLFLLSLPNFKHQSKLLLFPVPKSQALKRASSKPLFLCLSFNSNQQHGICQRVSYMYTLFIVFSGVLSFPKLCTPLENKDEYKSLIRSMAEVL